MAIFTLLLSKFVVSFVTAGYNNIVTTDIYLVWVGICYGFHEFTYKSHLYASYICESTSWSLEYEGAGSSASTYEQTGMAIQ